MANTATKVKIKPNLKLKEPSLYKVVYLNDNVTTMEFVVNSLVDYFDHTAKSALELTEKIHFDGSAVVAVMPHELAEQKGIEVTLDAHEQGFPLKIKIESEA
jgi:ATP-dependent Clp protease adaptor protein ClpS